jgi:hypothetical protein
VTTRAQRDERNRDEPHVKHYDSPAPTQVICEDCSNCISFAPLGSVDKLYLPMPTERTSFKRDSEGCSPRTALDESTSESKGSDVAPADAPYGQVKLPLVVRRMGQHVYDPLSKDSGQPIRSLRIEQGK